MYTVTYRDTRGHTGSVEVDVRTRKEISRFVARFNLPVVAVFEQATPITEAVRNDLKQNYKGVLSDGARAFVFPMNLQ